VFTTNDVSGILIDVPSLGRLWCRSYTDCIRHKFPPSAHGLYSCYAGKRVEMCDMKSFCIVGGRFPRAPKLSSDLRVVFAVRTLFFPFLHPLIVKQKIQHISNDRDFFTCIIFLFLGFLYPAIFISRVLLRVVTRGSAMEPGMYSCRYIVEEENKKRKEKRTKNNPPESKHGDSY